MSKPRIRKLRDAEWLMVPPSDFLPGCTVWGGGWVCTGDGVAGHGPTKFAAFCDWECRLLVARNEDQRRAAEADPPSLWDRLVGRFG